MSRHGLKRKVVVLMSKNAKSKWIQKAHLNEGAFTAQANKAGKTVQQYAEEMKNAPGTTGKRARLALTFEAMAARRKSMTDHLKKK
jgi:hypothetical protein